MDLRHVVLDIRPVPPQPLTLLLGICQSHPQEGKPRELPHHTLYKFLRRKRHSEDFRSIKPLHDAILLFDIKVTVKIKLRKLLITGDRVYRELLPSLQSLWLQPDCCCVAGRTRRSRSTDDFPAVPLKRSSSSASTTASRPGTNCTWSLHTEGRGTLMKV